MVLFHTIKELKEAIGPLRMAGKTIGFVPTMGALHEGHISLVKECCAGNDITVVSIFVNPTQFNNPDDLAKYPRTLGQDMKLLEAETGADFVFAPSVEEVYPEADTRVFDFDPLDKVMEGTARPGHFNGVAQVVSRLFEIVKPDTAYFGEKDFQQLAIIRRMVAQLQMPIAIQGMPIVRESNGLAMSSRNTRLSVQERQQAAIIYKALKQSVRDAEQKTVNEVIVQTIATINAEPGFEVEYFVIADGNTLQPIAQWSETDYAVGCITVYCGAVRLIDNITYFRK